MAIQVDEVFGVVPKVRSATYVDRNKLDSALARLLKRQTHIALRGESKCGKSWLRQKAIPDAIVVQCRLGKTMLDIYTDALSQLDIQLTIQRGAGSKVVGKVEASGEVGNSIFAKLGWKVSGEVGRDKSSTTQDVGKDINDLRFIADILRESGRRLVIEDFHYLSEAERKVCAFDIKSFWDYNLFVVIIGVWNEKNLFLNLNPDLTARVHELSIEWGEDDLKKILAQGETALNLRVSPQIANRAVADCFKNAGLFQSLILRALDEGGIYEASDTAVTFDSVGAYEDACMAYAEELNAVYQTFATRVSSGIRTRTDSTGIYAHAMAAVLDSSTDSELSIGIPIARIHEIAHARQPRIQLGNLHTILSRIEGVQVDDEGRGLVLAYNQRDRVVTVVDRQLLLYRRYATVKWPWDDLIAAADASATDAYLPDNS